LFFRYGRFSKSIRPDECRQCNLNSLLTYRYLPSENPLGCGACKEGKLIPLFASKKASSTGTPKLSKLAATKPQGSLPPFLYSQSLTSFRFTTHHARFLSLDPLCGRHGFRGRLDCGNPYEDSGIYFYHALKYLLHFSNIFRYLSCNRSIEYNSMIQVITRKEVEMATMNIRPDGSIREALLNRLVVIYRNDGYRVLWIQKNVTLSP